MPAIRKRVRLFVAATALIAAGCILAALGAVFHASEAWFFMFFGLPGTVLLSFFLIREFKRLQDAQLILDNRILHIRPVTGSAETSGRQSADGGFRIDFFVSCFGLLLDSKIIKFNQEGIRLKDVEIGRDYISLSYGTDKKTQKARLLLAAVDSRELTRIAEKFRYETGVMPTITSG